MAGAQKSSAYLEVSYPGQDSYFIDEVKEFSYSSSVTTVGDQCTFKVVNNDDGTTIDQLRLGARCRLKMKNPNVNGGVWNVKHSGRIVGREVDLAAGTVDVTVADLGWHLMHSSPPLYKRLRGLTLDQILDPNAAQPLIDPSFGFTGLRTGLDANKLNRSAKLGRAGLAPPGSVLQPAPVIQVSEGETYYAILTRYAQRYNLLINVGVDDKLQAWNPDHSRPSLYTFVCNKSGSNIVNAKRHDDATTRYTQVTCAGECLPSLIKADSAEPNVNKRRGTYVAPLDPRTGLPMPLPFTHRKTMGDGEMFTPEEAKGEAEWAWKQGLYQSHSLTISVEDHFQASTGFGDCWYESDLMAYVDIPGLRCTGLYYIEAVKCDSTEEAGDVTVLTLRWPYLLSAAYGEWGTPPKFSSPEASAALLPGTGTGA